MDELQKTKRLVKLSYLLIPIITVVLFFIVTILIQYGIFSSAHNRARESAARAKCLSNMKQIGLALKQYALDCQETLPFVSSDMEPYQSFGMLHPSYASAIEVFRCPSSRDLKWDVENIQELNYKIFAPFTKDACRKSLSYAYGHNKGNPWTESASPTSCISADKYATEDYLNGDNRKRPSNHATDGRNVVRLDGSASWDNNRGKLEADPEWDIKAKMSIENIDYKALPDSHPESDQTGADWWSDPPEK